MGKQLSLVDFLLPCLIPGVLTLPSLDSLIRQRIFKYSFVQNGIPFGTLTYVKLPEGTPRNSNVHGEYDHKNHPNLVVPDFKTKPHKHVWPSNCDMSVQYRPPKPTGWPSCNRFTPHQKTSDFDTPATRNKRAELGGLQLEFLDVPVSDIHI